MYKLLESELKVIKKIRGMAGCKKSPVRIVRQNESTTYTISDAGYSFDLTTLTSNEQIIALYDDYKKIKPVQVTLDDYSYESCGELADKKYIEGDYVYANEYTIVYGMDNVRLIASELSVNSDEFQSYQSRPIKNLLGFIKSRKGVVSWGLSGNNLVLESDIGSIRIKPSYKMSINRPDYFNVISEIASKPTQALTENLDVKTPVFIDKLLESLDKIGFISDRIAVYQPKKTNSIKVYTVVY